MSSSTTSIPHHYGTLVTLHQRLHHLRHLASIAGWDQAANMPPKGNEARAAALSELAGLMHGLQIGRAHV
mgnify:FL=1